MKQSLIRALATAAGLTLVASTWAQSSTATTQAPATQAAPAQRPAQGPGNGPQSGAGKHMQQGQHQGGEFGMGQLPQQVIDQLALSPAQKSQLDAAQQARKDMHAARKSAMANQRKAMQDQLAKDQLDPRAIMTQSNQMHSAMSAQREAVQQKWLSFWDGLSAEQRKTMTTYMKSRMAGSGDRPMQHGRHHG